MSTPETPLTSVNLSLRWPEEQPKALPANQFAVAMGLPTSSGEPDTVYLIVGHAEPPLLVDSRDGAVPAPKEVEIDVFGRYVFTRSRLEDLANLLQAAVAAYDRAAGGAEDATDKV
ncbi:hypothetical protein [Kitasatospora sp. NBC_01266]|uniref:hypothetical protein n=1 Tax=Kitasatospora sp. NBC_01266 TaxID=2903572 RepID=UPI002E2EBB96|nr:hypothetical protein [Kitasatospora sp. NBC_01266]